MIGAVQWNHLEIRGDYGGGSRAAGAAFALEAHARVTILDPGGVRASLRPWCTPGCRRRPGVRLCQNPSYALPRSRMRLSQAP